ncbi:phospholipase D-like domain-containing protein [Nitratiruptor tergarcus]|uniref:phospholipase D n=1 Tax=Nitratiruptor tergarcus DSM 16512 TaxID=1069081 RepID=A0A1W1WQ10_9BACT|nr:phospholipase D-like domain-containing protein [Nitratiruptor tergarcus]SMC08305.1 PLD-like domain-containing protein [Nitratiruptor tergarcus DSM 16512]
MKKFLLLSILSLVLLADDLYFMPFQSKQAQTKLLSWIDKAHSSIDIAMYSLTNRTIAKHIKNAARRGVKIRLVSDYEQSMKDRYSKIGYLAKYKNIKVRLIRGKYSKRGEFYGKMHLKLAIFDNKKLVFGSANWTNSAFKRNYELIYFAKNYALAKKALTTFERIFRKAQEY